MCRACPHDGRHPTWCSATGVWPPPNAAFSDTRHLLQATVAAPPLVGWRRVSAVPRAVSSSVFSTACPFIRRLLSVHDMVYKCDFLLTRAATMPRLCSVTKYDESSHFLWLYVEGMGIQELGTIKSASHYEEDSVRSVH